MAPIEALFPGTTTAEAGVDRQRLGECVIGVPDSLQALEQLVHPLVATDRRYTLRVYVCVCNNVLILFAPPYVTFMLTPIVTPIVPAVWPTHSYYCCVMLCCASAEPSLRALRQRGTSWWCTISPCSSRRDRTAMWTMWYVRSSLYFTFVPLSFRYFVQFGLIPWGGAVYPYYATSANP